MLQPKREGTQTPFLRRNSLQTKAREASGKRRSYPDILRTTGQPHFLPCPSSHCRPSLLLSLSPLNRQNRLVTSFLLRPSGHPSHLDTLRRSRISAWRRECPGHFLREGKGVRFDMKHLAGGFVKRRTVSAFLLLLSEEK
jgi:hypothetical protein